MKLIAGGLAVGAVGGTGSVSADGHIDATITMNNVMRRAYEVTEVPGSANVETGTENPDIVFTGSTGTRYQIVNNGYPNHPLQFENANGDTLLSQGEGVTGSLESDSDINWVDNGDSVEFTLTSTLATEIDTYRCTVHSGLMNGSITA
jgi:hypothetical protein